MKRREFLIGSSVMLGVGGCSLFADANRLRILGLAGAIPSKVVGQFEGAFSKATELKTAKTSQELWQELLSKPDADKKFDLTSIGDAWLDSAIAQSLIQPISPNLLAQMPQWTKLDPRWQQLVTRKTGEKSQVWGIPYRWGTTAIAYRLDKVKFEITKWADLWRPELKQKITLPDHPREVIGIVLKKLGDSYQQADLDSIKALSAELKQLHQQVFVYTSDTYLQPLLIDDSWVAVGWSQDMRKLPLQDPNIKVIIPTEGTALWSDIWVLPKQGNPDNQAAACHWMDYCLTPAIAAQISALTDAVTTSSALEQVPASVRADTIKFPAPQTIAQSEVLLPLSESTAKQYKEIWTKLRTNSL
ncbi:extracellular solute-binding protein [Tumidithrix elongata RA019]|uniref:Extracellular solute-binding protein n=1 Tax=Tumidithrix elongata BACA0141 TaxID=2716417 RepID=A0AAW9PUN6_9CYAN|nr:extracellular solute-binding protein [Tumidithrix elongata RA019]